MSIASRTLMLGFLNEGLWALGRWRKLAFRKAQGFTTWNKQIGIRSSVDALKYMGIVDECCYIAIIIGPPLLFIQLASDS